MPFGPHIIALLEDALTDTFEYHSELDTFFLRAGMAQGRLDSSRKLADSSYTGKYSRTPKRIVVQRVLNDLGSGALNDDRLLASIITALIKGQFPNAIQSGLEAIEGLRLAQAVERNEAEAKRANWERRQQEAQREKDLTGALKTTRRLNFEKEFYDLSAMIDSQNRGYALERFLSEFLEFEGLKPRRSFKQSGEQIDGSFAWASNTYLVEAKWVKERIAGAEFGAFIYKISGSPLTLEGCILQSMATRNRRYRD